MQRSEALTKKIGVLYGGTSSERSVSLETGAMIHKALVARGYDAILIDQGPDLPAALVAHGIDVAFIALHGKWGEDGCVQGLLEVMRIPYTGAKVFGSALAMDKHLSKIAFREAGLPVAPYAIVTRDLAAAFTAADLPFNLPAVVKPNAEGSSVGVTIVHDEAALRTALEEALRFDERLLVEKFVAGQEVSACVLNGEPLGVIGIKPARGFYDFTAKYQDDGTAYPYPAPLPPDQYARCLEIGRIANAVVRGEGATRADIIVADDGEMAVLEINTLPGMTSHSLVPQVARAEGIPFEELCERILLCASLGLSEPKEARR
ncbi:MAG: D-alanine--D-alanine ligase [Myxococcales bacterium]|nr:MAG: D-alanine--D-alanine ligase [Myxococcales bacterium]